MTNGDKRLVLSCYITYRNMGIRLLAIKNVLRMHGGHKPFSYDAISFLPKHYLMCSRFCLVWTLLLCIWKTDGFGCMFVRLLFLVLYLKESPQGPGVKMFEKS